jgi:hypothetical protein
MDRDAIASSFNAAARKLGWPSHCDASLSFDRPEFFDLLKMWQAARGTRKLPARGDLTARMLKPHLASTTIYEKFADAPARYRVRYMGTNFARTFGELTGKIIDEAVPPARAARFEATLDHVLRSSEPLRFISHADVIDKQFFVGEYFTAPLADADGKPTMVLSRAHFSEATDWPSYLAAALNRIELLPA